MQVQQCPLIYGLLTTVRNSFYSTTPLHYATTPLLTTGLGRQAPDDAGAQVVPNGVKVPCGKIIKDDSDGRALAYNEYIVYDTAQIKMRYVLKMKFGHKY